jgi:diguanylate cyclase (GGDEF)-like protein
MSEVQHSQYLGHPSASFQHPTSAAFRTLLLAAALTAGCAALIAALDLLGPPHGRGLLTWWMIAPLAVLAQVMAFDVEFRREACTVTFSEIPTVLGLFVADPLALIVGRVVGELVFLLGRERTINRKVALNLSSFVTETTLCLATARMLGVTSDIDNPRNWAIAFASVLVADLSGYLVIHRVLRWHGAPATVVDIIGFGGLAIPVNTSFALVVCILVNHQPWATLLLTSVAVGLLVSYRSYASLRQRFDSLSLLYDFTRLVSGAQRPDAVLEAMLTQAKDLMRAERAELWLDDGQQLVAMTVDDNGRHERVLPARSAQQMHQWFATHRQATIVTADSASADTADLAHLLKADEAIVSAITESGGVMGLVAVIDRLGEVKCFGEPDRMMFATLANHASVALENGRLIDRLHREAKVREHEAHHDALSGLPNRVLFHERLSAALAEFDARTGVLAVGLLDLDGFKEINDTLGHHIGDLVLIEVASRLQASLPDDVFVARLGGDEFALLFTGRRDRRWVERQARRARDTIAEPLVVQEMSLNVSGSIGLTLALTGVDGSTLLQRADVAMYSAKDGHGDGVAFYNASRDENSPRRLRLATDLRAALLADELELAFQPKVRLANGAIDSWEALARWHHPDLGPVTPDEFIPIAERTSCIRELTYNVLRRAAATVVQWRADGLDWRISVNIAVRNLFDDTFVESVRDILRMADCPAELLILEVTETGAMFDTGRAIGTLQALRAMGMSISVDDFGTGYSSLSYLQQMPATEVKIDKAFVRNLGHDERAAAIVRTILDLARNLGLHVAAEGVETKEALDELRSLGCELAQGYFVARPMPLADVRRWSTTWSQQQAATLAAATS